jgi:predicted component of type VI protein secretion system
MLRCAALMAQIADDIVFESMDECDPDSLARLAFAVNHMLRQLMDELRKSVSAVASDAKVALEMEERAAQLLD